MSAYSLFVRGAPFVVTPSFAASAEATATPAAILGVDLAAVAQVRTCVRVVAAAPFLCPYIFSFFCLFFLPFVLTLAYLFYQAKAWQALSFWTTTELSTPISELVLLLGVFPTHSGLLSFVWSRRAKKSSTVMLFLPLNLVAALLSRQLGTRLLGWLGLAGGAFQIMALRAMARKSQRRI
jgi:hypothetical protein